MKKTTSSITFLLSTTVGVGGPGENWPREKWPTQAIMTLNAGKQRDTDESIVQTWYQI